MSTSTQVTFTKEQLFADINRDELPIDGDKINRARNGDGSAMHDIAFEYHSRREDYPKAMAWYRLAAAKNNSASQNNTGFMYEHGQSVPVDYLIALEWYLKAAQQGNSRAGEHISECFEYGRGVPINIYKALEWCFKSGSQPDNIRRLSKQGVQVRKQDKKKSVEQLIMETEDIIRAAREKKEVELMEENKVLQKEIRAFRVLAERKREENSGQRGAVEEYKHEVQTINNEFQALKQVMNTFEMKLEAKDSKIDRLENEIKQLQITSEYSSQNPSKIIKELQTSNQNFKELLEQERQLKDNQIELLKHKMELLLEKEKKKRTKLEEENQAMKEELKNSKRTIQNMRYL